MSPDEKFMRCCQERNLPDACLSKCSFRTYTKTALQAMYFKQDYCPMQAAADIQYCAAQGQDHTSTGLLANIENYKGEGYERIARGIVFDHDAILLN
ncbi:hypothetical protein FTX61_25705, partial [Nitriliruptoraceae bacterium ZYF776]|nr:hypothetical protein [Profundirhabdus halotolerans]